MSSRVRLEITDDPSIGHIHIRTQVKTSKKYIVDVASSMYLYLVLSRSDLMKDQ